MANHSPEPWTVETFSDQFVASAGGKMIVLTEIGPHDGVQIKRAVACVNACAGIYPAGIPDALKAAWAVVSATIHDDTEALIGKLLIALNATEVGE